MTFTPLLREGKNMSTLTTFLDRFEKNIQEICELNEIRKQLEARHRAFQSAIYTAFNSPPKTSESAEDYVRRMAADKTALEGRRRELVAITTAIDENPLPRSSDETYEEYALRLGDYLAGIIKALSSRGQFDGETTEFLRKVLSERQLSATAIAERDARIARLETRESELNDLHDTIDSLPGFPMQPPETYAEYLQRLAAANTLNDERATAMDNHLQAIEKAILKADAFRKLPKESFAEYITRLAADRARLAADLEHLKESTQETTQRLRAQLDGNNQQYAESMAVIDDLRKQRDEWTEHKYLVHFEPGAHGLSWAVVDKGVIAEISPFLSGSDVRGLSAPKPQIGLWFTRVVHKPCPNSLQSMQVEMPVVIRAIENAEAAKAAVNMDAEISKLATERDNFRARWEESLAERDRAVDEARRTSETNQALHGEVTLRSQILARIMIDPSTDKLFNDREWNAAARKVLIEARGMVSDTPSDHARERYASEVKEMLRPYAE